MSITQKIVLLVGGALVSVFLIFGLYITLNRPVEIIRNERKVLDTLIVTMTELDLAGSRLFLDTYIDSIEPLETALANLDRVFEEIHQLSVIPGLSEETETAHQGILNLYEAFFRDAGQTLLDGAREMEEVVRENFLSQVSVTTLNWFEHVGSDISPSTRNASTVRFSLFRLRRQYSELSSALGLGRQVSSRQFEVIDQAILQVTQQASRIASISLAVSVLLIALAAWVVARRMTRPLRRIEVVVSQISKGDLGIQVEIRSKDEIGRLGGNINHLLRALNQSLGSIQDISRTSKELEEELNQSLIQASSSAVEIEANIQSIANQMSSLDDVSKVAGVSSSHMDGAVQSAVEAVRKQNSLYQKTGATMREMLDSVNQISQHVESTWDAAIELVTASQQGQEVFSDLQQKLSEITVSVGSVQEMAKIISDIAERTNLLAMNAAIEAARAGESGRGFAVVAGEIRKLAAASAQSTQSIDGTVTGIVERITEAERAKVETEAAFTTIAQGIQRVSSAAESSRGQLKQVQSRGDIILSSVQELEQHSQRTGTEAHSLEQGMQVLGDQIGRIERVSSEVHSSVNEITTGLAGMVALFREAELVSHTMGELGGRLQGSVEYYHLAGPGHKPRMTELSKKQPPYPIVLPAEG